VVAADVDGVIERLLQEGLREVFIVDAQLRSNSAVRAMRRDTLFQRRLSVHCAVEMRDYIDVHQAADILEVERRLTERRARPEQRLVLDDSRWSHKAWMSKIDVDLFERILLRQGQTVGPQFEVLEWGAGRSTLYFTEHLRQSGQTFRWLAIDYDRGYVEREIAPKLADRPGVHLTYADGPAPATAAEVEIVVYDKGLLQPFLAGREQDRRADLDDYVTYPARLSRRFDFIFVDGRKRRRCLIEAARLLKPNGLVLLHDSYRRHYQCAFRHYRYQRMLGEILWIGSQADTDFLDWIL
jgi:SAM-dependent methyltransferase